MYALAIQKIGDSLGITLPTELLEKLKVGEGDSIFITETAEGIQITTRDPDFEKAMEIYKQGSEKYKNALRELAK
ncbi:AbrB/MazE/SpoVT family DNA-binding domain-containing protein [Argonema galeatum]|uniref:AbrB/MazE/SpoVT family DNA-binding domain-containing protein n=1 Tax=Argonema galeatum TaxID=2942762 RepID=UPI00201291BD|nr:AbrB/MazE/SpoVT family DNA-binding domain-containing protein [Argonema galeatum]MCL1463376.1 AbrB/MazE/SpoVT family DNA-binding domain-containing protein [Argonema galeatum A003/A1]